MEYPTRRLLDFIGFFLAVGGSLMSIPSLMYGNYVMLTVFLLLAIAGIGLVAVLYE